MTEEFTAQDYQRARQEVERRKLSFYRPYRKQQEFHKAGATYRERLLRAGNQLGKCVSYETLIDLADGTQQQAGSLYNDGKQFEVMALHGVERVKALVTHAVRKPAEQCYRVWFSNGRWIEAAGMHLILISDGRWHSLRSLLKFVPCLPSSNSEFGLLTHVSDVQHWLEKQQDSLGNYNSGLHLYDEQPHVVAGTYQAFLPSPTDAQLHNCALCGLDDLGCKHIHTRLLKPAHPSNQDGVHQNEDRYAGFSIDGAYTDAQYKIESTLGSLPLSTEEASPLQSGVLTSQYPLFHLQNEENHIIAYQPVGVRSIYDFTVPKYSNYFTAGVVHHNTMAAAAETAIHATGKYPSWWEGRVFKKAPVIWCAGVTGEVVRDTIQRLLIGDTNTAGFIPNEDIIDATPSRGVADLKDTIFVKHSSGGTTRLRLKYYEQGREKFQGDTVNFGWPDEEPPLDIYLEMLTRTNATGGCMCMTFTPLKGMSEVVRRFLVDSSPDRHDTNMTIIDALHIAPEERQRIIESYPAHEREARINGTPMLGSGRIFPIAESEITIKPFNSMDMPWYWMELGGIDFGWDHPTAAAKILYDPQGDIIYLTNVYKRREATPLIHAAALKPWGKELQWAWPHDGLQHDKGSGVQLKEQYQQQGLKMLGEKATFDDERSNGVEAGIAEMLMRMESGRFKVFSHLTEFFEEFRLYHRKDGKIVKEYDDIICSVRHCIMMLRYAEPIRPPASSVQNSQGNFKSNYNPLSPSYIKKSLAERK